MPTMKAAAMASAPMWMGSSVAIRKIRQRTSIETTSADMDSDLPGRRAFRTTADSTLLKFRIPEL